MNIKEVLESYEKEAIVVPQESHSPDITLLKYIADQKMRLSEILLFLNKSGDAELRKVITENVLKTLSSIKTEVYQNIMLLLSFLYQPGFNLEEANKSRSVKGPVLPTSSGTAKNFPKKPSGLREGN